MCESFFATPGCELLERECFRNQASAKMKIFERTNILASGFSGSNSSPTFDDRTATAPAPGRPPARTVATAFPPIPDAPLMKRIAIVALGLFLMACSDGRPDLLEPAPVQPNLTATAANASYIVVLREGAGPADVARSVGASPRFVYSAVLNGFAADMTAVQAAALGRNPRVAYVEPDGEVSIVATQNNATWGIDRVDQQSLPLDGTYTYATTGASVHAYIIDTGIRSDHREFDGRAQQVYNSAGGKNTDCNGHGTHVAGTVGGTTYGIAKGVKLYGVKVLNCAGSGTWSGVIAGMDWVGNNRVTPAVANLSLGGGKSQAVDDAVARLVAAGVYVVVAAGNSDADACQSSPAGAPGAMTVAASTKTDTKASYSNWGSCVDLYAPGSSITSAWHSSRTAINTISGTSMAAPHVAGVAALYRATNPGDGTSAVTSWLTGNATTGKIAGNVGSTPNRLLFKGAL
jgi:subtilisin family serine protease